MKIWLFVLSIVVFSNMGWSDQQKTPYSSPLMTSDGYPSEDLLKLLQLLDVSHDGTWNSIVEVTQKTWLRPAGKERWEIEDPYLQSKDAIIPFLANLGFINEVRPQQLQYQTACVCGGALPSARLRLAYLLETWNSGVRLRQLVFLCGARPLTHPKENQEEYLNRNNGVLPIREDWVFDGTLPTTEAEMIKLLYDQADLPQELRKIPVLFIDTPMQTNADGTTRRPNRAETILDLFKLELAGSFIFVSSQPFLLYDYTTAAGLWNTDDTFEVVGKEAQSPSIAVCLDSLARVLYTGWLVGFY